MFHSHVYSYTSGIELKISVGAQTRNVATKYKVLHITVLTQALIILDVNLVLRFSWPCKEQTCIQGNIF